MNRRDILGSLAAWATAASAVAASEKASIPTSVEGWPTKPLPDDHPLAPMFAEDAKIVDRLRREYEDRKTTVLPMNVNIHRIQPAKTFLVFRLTQPVSQEMVDGLRRNIERWVRDSHLDCVGLLLPYGLELDIHRIPVDTASPGVSS